MNRRWLRENNWVTFLVVVVAIALVLIIGVLPLLAPQWKWAAIMLVFAALIVFTGIVRSIPEDPTSPCPNGRWDGAFIDARNKISLSRFQLVLWTVIVFSAWGTVALHRVRPASPSVAWGEDTARWALMCRFEKDGMNKLEPEECTALLAGDPVGAEPDTAGVDALITLLTGGPADEVSGDYEALNVTIPTDIWLLLGISTASLVGAGLIKVNKTGAPEESRAVRAMDEQIRAAQKRLADLQGVAGQKGAQATATSRQLAAWQAELAGVQDTLAQLPAGAPQPADLVAKENELTNKIAAAEVLYQKQQAEALAAAREQQPAIDAAQAEVARLEAERDQERVGSLHVNNTICQARWADLFSAESVGDQRLTDLGKVQMFLITLVLLFAYAALIWAQLSAPGADLALRLLPSVSLPAVSQSMVALFGISHAGYLAAKQVMQ